jgi:hypothetical protein
MSTGAGAPCFLGERCPQGPTRRMRWRRAFGPSRLCSRLHWAAIFKRPFRRPTDARAVLHDAALTRQLTIREHVLVPRQIVLTPHSHASYFALTPCSFRNTTRGRRPNYGLALHRGCSECHRCRAASALPLRMLPPQRGHRSRIGPCRRGDRSSLLRGGRWRRQAFCRWLSRYKARDWQQFAMLPHGAAPCVLGLWRVA